MSHVLPTPYQQMIHLSRYARWIDELGRRETWEETVDRYIEYMFDVRCGGKCGKDIKKEIREAILGLEVMPSMRCMMTAGPALEKDAAAAYNCSFVAMSNVAAFDEMMYLLMCFHPDTKVRVRGGTKRVSEITPEDEVESLDTSTGKTVYVRPSRVLKNPTENMPKMRLTFEDGSEVVCTESHLFYTKNRGWVKACELTGEDDL